MRAGSSTGSTTDFARTPARKRFTKRCSIKIDSGVGFRSRIQIRIHMGRVQETDSGNRSQMNRSQMSRIR